MNQQELLSEDEKKAGLYLIELMRAALNGEQAAEIPEDVSWEKVYKLARFHKVESLSAYGLLGLQKLPSKELLQEWNQTKTNTLFRILHFDTEREQIFAEMEKKQIAYLPLKGILLSTYYPDLSMRTMADNDILYGFVEKAENGEYKIAGGNDKEQEENVKKAQALMVEIMSQRGFDVEGLVGNHDTFHKKPFYNFEMHRELVSTVSKHKAYYKNSWAKAVLDKPSSFAFHMKNEDEYIFMLVHMEKHFSYGGCGIRHLNDVYVFLRKKGELLEQKYLQQELKKLEMEEFERDVRTLSWAIYAENRALTEKEQDMLNYLLGCGIYGRADVEVANKIASFKNEKEVSRILPRLRYIKSRIFVEEKMMEEYYPLFYKYVWLRPILPLYRVLKGMCIHPRRLAAEWKSIWKK